MAELENYYNKIYNLLSNKNNYINKPKAFVKTYGCQQNVTDSEKYKGMLINMGYSLTNNVGDADFILFNTCAIREHAEEKVFGNVGALKQQKIKNKNLIIALCGCMTQQEHIAKRIKLKYPFVDMVFGTSYINEFSKLLYDVMKSKDKKRIFANELNNMLVSEDIPSHRDGKYKAFLPIMYGCDNFCTYCIVPYVRGRERSRKVEDILKEANDLIKSGYKDITLLGQNVNSYGKGLGEDINFPKLLQKICDLKGDFIVRFMTSHPKDATKEMIDVMASNKKIAKHIHLPVQSGSDKILKKMNRVYNREQYLEIVSYAKEKMPNICITSDIIVGFPGETYDDFKQTLSLVKEVGYSSLFTFIYSKREGTPAAKMEDTISKADKMLWFNELLKVQEGESAALCKTMIGKTQIMLIEGTAKKESGLLAKTSGNITVLLEGDKELIGTFQNVEITESLNYILKGKIK